MVVERVRQYKTEFWEKLCRKVFFGVFKWDIFDYDGCINEIGIRLRVQKFLLISYRTGNWDGGGLLEY